MHRWHQTASQVQPSLMDKENMSIFVSTLPLPFYDRMIGYTNSSFATLVLTKRELNMVEKGEGSKTIKPF